MLHEEGEAQLRAALDRHPSLTVEDSLPEGVSADWRAEGGGLRTRPDFWGERGGMDGFFMVKICKT